MITRRYLDESESALYEAVSDPSFTAVYDGVIDEQVLRRAFHLHCTRNPVLRGKIRAEGGRYLLEVPDGNFPKLVVYEGGERIWLRESSTDKIIEWNQARDTLVRLVLIRGKSCGYLIFYLNHAIVDATAFMLHFSELWRLYTDMVNGNDPSVGTVRPLPSSPSELLCNRWGKARWGDERPPVPGPTGEPTSRIDGSVRLDRGDTARLVTAARRNGVTVGGLLFGALAVTLRAENPAIGEVPTTTGTVVNLRNHVIPPVKETDVTDFCAYTQIRMSIAADADAIRLAKDFKTKLAHNISKRDLVFPRHPIPMAEFDIFFNNAGSIPSFEHPSDLTITDLIRTTSPLDRRTRIKWSKNIPMPRIALIVYAYNDMMKLMFSCDEDDEHVVDKFVTNCVSFS